jgi:hypothetical protein
MDSREMTGQHCRATLPPRFGAHTAGSVGEAAFGLRYLSFPSLEGRKRALADRPLAMFQVYKDLFDTQRRLLAIIRAGGGARLDAIRPKHQSNPGRVNYFFDPEAVQDETALLRIGDAHQDAFPISR